MAFCPEEVIPAVEAILPGGERRAEVEAGMSEMAEMLGADSDEPALRRAAEAIWEW